MTGCNWTLSRKTRRKAKEKHQNQKGNRTTSMTITSSTDINTCRNCGRTGHWAKDCWRPGGDAYDKSTSNNSNTQEKGRVTRKAKGKSKHVDVVETNQPSETASTVSCPSQTPSTKRGTVDHGCDNQFRVYKETNWCRALASGQWRTASRMSDQVSRTKSTVA